MFYSPTAGGIDNLQAARAVFSVASLLESLGANPYRVRAYRRAAVGLLRLPTAASQLLDGQGQLALPWLGPRLRRKLGELVRRGRMQFHDDLIANLPPPMRDLLAIPGVGPKTAARLIVDLSIADAAGVARAAQSGRLRALRGIGPVREQRLGEAAAALLAAGGAEAHRGVDAP
jgi:DNA polymerase (family 10)